MEELKDFYGILGVEENASKEDIAKAYKKLALKYHPDRHVNDTPEERNRCEEEFKKISEAYDTLSDDNKRQEFDMRRKNPFGGGAPFGEGFPFGGGFRFRTDGFNPFDGGFGFNGGVSDGEDITIDCDITLQEAYDGIEKTVTYTRQSPCKHCNGTGNEDGTSDLCPHCKGTGMISSMQQTIFGQAQVHTTCPHCGGSGVNNSNTSKTKCPHCKGTGLEVETLTISIKVPKGTFDGMAISLREMGDSPANGRGKKGDLIIRFNVTNNTDFEIMRGTINLFRKEKITLKEALLGFKKTIKGLDGKDIVIDSKNPVNNGTPFTFTGKGLPHPQRSGLYGDLIVELEIDLPSTLTGEQIEMIQKIDF